MVIVESLPSYSMLRSLSIAVDVRCWDEFNYTIHTEHREKNTQQSKYETNENNLPRWKEKTKTQATARTRQHFIALFRAPAIQSKRLDFFSRSPIVSYHIVFMCMKHIQCKPNTRTIETFEHGLCEKWNRIRSRGWTKNMKRKEYLCGMEMKRIAEKLCVFDRSINNMIWSRKYSWRAYKILKTIYLLGNLIVNFFIRSFTIIMKLRKFFTLNCKWFVIFYVCVCVCIWKGWNYSCHPTNYVINDAVLCSRLWRGVRNGKKNLKWNSFASIHWLLHNMLIAHRHTITFIITTTTNTSIR